MTRLVPSVGHILSGLDHSSTSSNNIPFVNTNSPALKTKLVPREGSNRVERQSDLSDCSSSWQEARRLHLLDSKHERQTESLPLLDGKSDIKGWRAIVTGANTGKCVFQSAAPLSSRLIDHRSQRHRL